MASEKRFGAVAWENETGTEEISEICNVCTLPHRTEECPLICTGKKVQDSKLPTKAVLTLPDTLNYKKLMDCSYEITSKMGFSKGIQFGPLDAPKKNLFNPKCSYVLKLFSCRDYFCYLDICDEENCNWMCLVPFTEDMQIRNCICYQLRDEIYFSVVQDILPGQCLIVSYSPGYAAQIQASNKFVEDNVVSKTPLTAATTNNKKHLSTHNNVPIYAVKSRPVSILLEDHNSNDQVNTISDQGSSVVSNEVQSTRRSQRVKKSVAESENDFVFESVPKKEVCKGSSDAEGVDDHNGDSGKSSLGISEVFLDDVDVDDVLSFEERSSKAKRRMGAVLAVDSWKCKFCRLEIKTIAEFAVHLMDHYKTVGAARTEKSRLNRKAFARDGNSDAYIKEEPIKEEPDGETEDRKMTNNAVQVVPTFPYYCDICVSHKPFNRAEYVIRHLRKHSGENYCSHCDKEFAGKDSLYNHDCASVDKGCKIKCTLCSKKFSSQHLLKQHVKTKHGETQKCRTCRRIFSNLNALKKHVCKRKKQLPAARDISILHKCNVCGEKFDRVKELEKHLSVHKESLSCNYCHKPLSNDSYKMHQSICEMLDVFIRDANRVLQCPIPMCVSIFQNVNNFRYHMASHTHPYMCPKCNLRLRFNSDIKYHDCVPFTCDAKDCNTKFQTLQDLKHHIDDRHEDIKSYCFECAYPFVTDEGYANHTCCDEEYNLMKEVSTISVKRAKKPKINKEGEFVCEKCGAKYTKWSSLKTHRYTHGPKRHVCEICGLKFHRREILADHLFVHQDAQFECNVCGKKLKSKRSLCVHLRIHTGELPFQCQECGKGFKQKVNLKTHQIVHLKSQGFQGFPCPYCDKTYSSREYLSFHVEEHEKGRNHVCDICGKTFVKGHMVKQHKKVCHANCKFGCEFCDLVVRLSYSLKRHLKNRHSEYSDIWNQPGYLLSRMIPNVGNNAASSSLKCETLIIDEINDCSDDVSMVEEVNSLNSQDISMVSNDNIIKYPQSNMVLVQMKSGGEFVLALTRPGETEDDDQTMIEVEAEVIDAE